MTTAQSYESRKGFTLIELLVVIGILAVLLAIVLVAINPARQFGQANNTKRRSDIQAILNAVGAYAADNHGALPAAITAVDGTISKAARDVCLSLVPNYISALPADPNTNNGAAVTDCASNYVTGYNVVHDANNRVTVSAPGAENTETISITR
jgi:prepilin-type N-terminal cleavage/methylation domain-containing protein